MSIPSNTPTISVDNRKHPCDIIADARQELADLYVVKFPELGLTENKAALDLLVNEKFEQLTSAILEEADIDAEMAFLDGRARDSARGFLQSLGALPPPPDDDEGAPRTAAQIAFARDFAPVVGSDGGFPQTPTHSSTTKGRSR